MTTTSSELTALRTCLDERGATRVMLITGSGRRFLDEVMPLLHGIEVHVFDGAEAHVPEPVVQRAQADLARFSPQAVVTLGGGSATGLGKALRLEHDFLFVAIPTTYAGSEMNGIYGVTSDEDKRTGRDDRVRPDFVIHDVALTYTMPRRLTVTSLMNALAHPLSALCTGTLDTENRDQALGAIRDLVRALDTLVAKPGHREARRRAARGAAAAGRVLDAGALGDHHRVAHHLGGRLKMDHSTLHACLLPHSAAALLNDGPELAGRIQELTAFDDLPGTLFEMLRRVAAPTALSQMTDPEAVTSAVNELADTGLPPAVMEWTQNAQLGRNPSRRFQPIEVGLDLPAMCVKPVDVARRIVVAIHGRNATAESILAEARAIVGDAPDTLVLAPQAPTGSWYSGSYRASRESLGDALPAALQTVGVCVGWARTHVGDMNTFLLGFSQGACLALEWAAQTDAPLGGVVALSGARIGPAEAQSPPTAAAAATPLVITIAREDPWLDSGDVRRAATDLEGASAKVTLIEAAPGTHGIRPLERIRARELILGRQDAGSAGFGNYHHTEDLPGAVPLDQNSPRRASYGLYAEQINGTGFVAHRHQNLRSWSYRVRPAAQHTPFEPLEHPTLVTRFDGPQDPNLAAWPPPPMPEAATDFVDGLITLGGAGSAELRRGFAVHLYAANRSMDNRAFYNADSDLLIIPHRGAMTLQTDMGVLELGPGKVAVMPRGIRFSVLMPAGEARGYVAEVFGRHFELPERGPVGANGPTDPRHFVAPAAWHEDRLHPAHRLTAQFGGQLFEAVQDYSPYDVAGWHGNYTPYVYDLMHFCPVGFTRFDHIDPSIFSVLSAPMDELGSHTLDFVFFPPRWDVSEHTFRPPYFHRNATTEINGIIHDPSLGEDSPFQPGSVFLTPSMTAHGVIDRGVERAFAESNEAADRPHRIGDGSMWFQFESALPLRLTPWARDPAHHRGDWTDIWGVYRTHFDPLARRANWK